MKKYLFLITLSGILFSCGNNQKKEPEVKTVDSSTETLQASTSNVVFKDKEMSLVYESYIGLKNALVNSEAEKTQIMAKNLMKTIENAKIDGPIKETVYKIASVNDIQTQREVFQFLSEEMIKLAEKSFSSGKLFIQYCPMAFQGKGAYWISNQKEIRNPYYGDKMMKCGEVRKVLE